MIEVGLFDRMDALAIAHLSSFGIQVCSVQSSTSSTATAAEFATTAASDQMSNSIEAALIRSRTKVNSHFISRYPNLKLVVSMTAGFDHIDLEALKARQIRAEHCPSSHTQSAAELTIGLAFQSLRKLHTAHPYTLSGKGWDDSRRTLLGSEVSGRTWGVVGLGRIGRKVAAMAKALGAPTVFAYDPFIEESDFKTSGCQRVGLEELFELSDTISLHVPLSRQTRKMIHRAFFDRLRETSLLINTSRGEVLNEVDLFEHFRLGKPGHFALDVFSEEPIVPKSAAYENLKLAESQGRVTLAPHIGAFTEDAFRRVSLEGAQRILRFFKPDQALGTLAWTGGELPPQAAWFNSDYTL